MREQLLAYCEDKRVGVIEWDRKKNQLSFEYDELWRAHPKSYPISLSMPLALKVHPGEKIENYLWGLLPDNHQTLQRWAKRFGVSPGNAFRLIENVGEDCAGAIHFIHPDREASWLSAQSDTIDVDWMDEGELSDRIKLLIHDHSASRKAEDRGYFSLAGAQPKTALFFDSVTSKWGVPQGLTPSTHILKPATGEFDGFAENEHFCLCLAKQLGFKTSNTEVLKLDGNSVIVVERYDRVFRKNSQGVIRIHQEDFCQALSINPQLKYQNEGGPSAQDIINVIRGNSSNSNEDVWRFVEALILNWIIVGTDAHAKNFSLMLAANGQCRLSPLYDVISILPYPQNYNPRKTKMAMKIGKKYKVCEISALVWGDFAKENKLRYDEVFDRMERMLDQLPDALDATAERVIQDGITHNIIPPLVRAIKERVEYNKESIKVAKGALK